VVDFDVVAAPELNVGAIFNAHFTPLTFGATFTVCQQKFI